MLFRDYATPFPPTSKTGGAGGPGHGKVFPSRLGGKLEQAPEISEVSEVTWGNERPFYSRPSQRNRRFQPLRKWFVASGFLMSAGFGYLLGLYHRPPASPPVLTKLPTAEPSSSSAARSETKIVTLKSGRPQTKLIALKHGTSGTKIAALKSGSSGTKLVALKGGAYLMGDSLDGSKDARTHQVTLTPFLMATHEVSLEVWERVVLWGRDHGYPDLPAGSGKAHNHPVSGISWGDAVKWCNALSEKEGLEPCYYTDTIRQKVARRGSMDIGNQHVNWGSSGYRLPTEAEWEFAARGGLADKRFPWSNEITHEQANYHGSPLIEYDKSQHEGTATALMSTTPYTAGIGSFRPNGFGLYDMAGNVAEWCWDFYDPSYGTPTPLLNNPHGPDKGKNCVVRGGSWRHTAADARCASRFCLPGDRSAMYVGFRVVRGQ